jgi:hypothetical protein
MNVKRLWIVAIGLVITIILTWLLRDLVRQILAVPILFIGWLIRAIYYMLPQSLVWAIVIALALAIALGSFSWRVSSGTRMPSSGRRQAEQRVAILRHYIQQSNRNFYRHRLKHALSELVLRLLAYEQQISYQALKMALYRKELKMPPDMQQFLYEGLPMWSMESSGKRNLWARFFQPKESSDKMIKQAEQVLQYLETRLEVNSDD